MAASPNVAPPTAHRTDNEPEQGVIASSQAILQQKFMPLVQSALEGNLKIPAAVAKGWLGMAQSLTKTTQLPQVVVGVVGSTGTGKSSLLNALLDENKLIPTNSFRACTPAPTEISFNHSNDPKELYKAVIEYITKDEWLQELRFLHEDIKCSDGGSPDNESLEVTAAWAKFHAVYPYKLRSELIKGNLTALLKDRVIASILGNVVEVSAESAKEMAGDLEGYACGRESGDEVQVWPLIKRIKVLIKADVLARGLKLVDLPGLHDRNEARASVAKRYIKSCDGIFIIAPITRAADDAVLMSIDKEFRNQLVYNGMLSAVTIVCSKTDDFDEEEIAISLLRRSEEYCKLREALLVTQKEVAKAEADAAELKKRQRDLRKRSKQMAPDDASRAKIELEQLLQQEDDAEDAYSTLKEQEEQVNIAISRTCLQTRNEAARKAVLEEYVAGAREYDKYDLEQAFQSVMRSEEQGALAPETTARPAPTQPSHHDDDNNKNDLALSQVPRQKHMGKSLGLQTGDRMFQEAAQLAKVFCVSARTYNKLRADLGKDTKPGFVSYEDTEIPQLREHALNLVSSEQDATTVAHLVGLKQLLVSLNGWIRPGREFGAGRAAEISKQLSKTLLQTLTETARHRLGVMGHYVNDNDSLPRALESLARLSATRAEGAVADWNDAPGKGGLRYNTYKAICRRDGSWRGKGGLVDLNQGLFAPFDQGLAKLWAQMFSLVFNAGVKKWAHEDAARALLAYQTEFRNCLGANTIHQRHRDILESVDNGRRMCSGFVKRWLTQALAWLGQYQRASHFPDAVRDAMRPVYAAVSTMTSLHDIRTAMDRHVKENGLVMFRAAKVQILDFLRGMLELLEKSWLDWIKGTADYPYKHLDESLKNEEPSGEDEKEESPELKQFKEQVDDIFEELEEILPLRETRDLRS